MKQMPEKQCSYCQKIIRGRSDKKFCNDYCRNYYNQQKKTKEGQVEKKINRILSQNRKTLQNLTQKNNFVRVKKDRLLSMGFDQKFITEHTLLKTGHPCFYCYEFGYLHVGNNQVVIFEKTLSYADNFNSA